MEHDFYHLNEAAKLLECEERDLLKWGAAGKIDLCVWYEGNIIDSQVQLWMAELISCEMPTHGSAMMGWKGFLSLLAADIMRLFINGGNLSTGVICVDRLRLESNDVDGDISPVFALVWQDDDDGERHNRHLEPTIDDLFITSATFNTIRKDLEKSTTIPNDARADILDPEHPWHSELLAIAVKAWIELYSKREGNSSDNTYKPSGGHIAMIENWLSEQKSPLLNRTSREYLGKVINPSKGGGPNKARE